MAQTETKTAYQVIAASYALQFLTEQIAGEAIEVKFLVDDSQDPKTWRPTVEQVKEIQKSDLVVVNGTGATYAEWLKRVSLLESKICFSAETFPTAEYIFVADYQVVHSHGPEGEHSHDYSVPYCWLDPANASQQASEICESLKRTYPDKAEEFDERLAALQTKLKSLSDEFDAAKEQNNSRQVLSVNPRMKYLTRAAGLDDVHLFAFDADSDLTSSKEKLKSLTASEDFSPACVLVENSSTSSIEDLLPDQAASDWPQTEVNLLDHRPKEGDYFSAMQSNLKALELPN